MESKVNKNLDKKNIIIKGDFFTLTPFSLEFVTARYLSWLHDKKINKYLAKAGHETSLSKAKEYCDYLFNKSLMFNDLIINHPNVYFY